MTTSLRVTALILLVSGQALAAPCVPQSFEDALRADPNMAWALDNDKFVESFKPESDSEALRMGVNLARLEREGISPTEVQSAYATLGTDSRNFEAFRRLLSSHKLTNEPFRRVMKSYLALRNGIPGEEIPFEFYDLDGMLPGMGISKWSDRAKTGLANVLERASAIRGSSPGTSANAAFEKAASEYGILYKIKKCTL